MEQQDLPRVEREVEVRPLRNDGEHAARQDRIPATSTPRTRAIPAVGTTRVVRMPIVVVLPAPFGPSKPNTSPGGTWKSTSSTAFVGRLGYRFTRLTTSTAGSFTQAPSHGGSLGFRPR
jgi:hypothetical protein